MKIKSFEEFTNKTDIKLHGNIKEHFLVNDIYVTETMNSSYSIIETRKTDGVDEYLIQTDSKKYYKIYVEIIHNNNDKYIDVGFLRYSGEKGKGKWITNGILNDLTSTELLKLFGTLKNITLTYDAVRIYIGTNNEPLKMIKYMKILNRLNLPGYILSHDEHNDFCLSRDYKEDNTFMLNLIKFKRKFKSKG